MLHEIRCPGAVRVWGGVRYRAAVPFAPCSATSASCPRNSSRLRRSAPSTGSGYSATSTTRRRRANGRSSSTCSPCWIWPRSIIDRAKSPFAVNVRALDAIHVATAEILAAEAEGEPLEFWTHDDLQATAALSRGFTVRGVQGPSTDEQLDLLTGLRTGPGSLGTTCAALAGISCSDSALGIGVLEGLRDHRQQRPPWWPTRGASRAREIGRALEVLRDGLHPARPGPPKERFRVPVGDEESLVVDLVEAVEPADVLGTPLRVSAGGEGVDAPGLDPGSSVGREGVPAASSGWYVARRRGGCSPPDLSSRGRHCTRTATPWTSTPCT